MKPIYFLYARKSSESEERQALSIEAQLTELKQFADRDKLTISQIFIESQSAKTPGRPIFNDMMARLEKGEANGIIAWHPDRLARNSVDGGRIVYNLDTKHVEFLKFPTFWFENTPQGKFMLNIAFGQSKYDPWKSPTGDESIIYLKMFVGVFVKKFAGVSFPASLPQDISTISS